MTKITYEPINLDVKNARLLLQTGIDFLDTFEDENEVLNFFEYEFSENVVVNPSLPEGRQVTHKYHDCRFVLVVDAN